MLGTELRERSRAILARSIDANHSRDRAARLEQLRGDLENFKVMVRLCHESGGFASTRSYLYVAEQVVELSRQNEGWLRQTIKARGGGAERDRSGEAPRALAKKVDELIDAEITRAENLGHQPGADCFSGVYWHHDRPAIGVPEEVMAPRTRMTSNSIFASAAITCVPVGRGKRVMRRG